MGVVEWIAVVASPILVGFIAWTAKEWIQSTAQSIKSIRDNQSKHEDRVESELKARAAENRQFGNELQKQVSSIHSHVVDIKAATNDELLRLHSVVLELQTRSDRLQFVTDAMFKDVKESHGRIIIIEKYYNEATKSIQILARVLKRFQLDLDNLKKSDKQ